MSTAVSRRRFLVAGAAAGGLALVSAACGDDGDEVAGRSSGTTGGGGQAVRVTAAELAAFAAGLEVLAVNTYDTILDAATGGRLGTVPAAGADYLRTALSHHEQHRDAWNTVLRSAGGPEVTRPDARLKPTVDAELAKVRGFLDAARLALAVEEIAAATYLDAIPSLSSKEAVRRAASIQAVDAKHAAILRFLLGEYPAPDAFARTDKAAEPG